MHREGEALKFQTRPNIYRVIAQTAEDSRHPPSPSGLRAEVDGVIGEAPGFRVLPWPEMMAKYPTTRTLP